MGSTMVRHPTEGSSIGCLRRSHDLRPSKCPRANHARWLGYIERHTLKKGDLVQLERIGYARYEGMKDDVDSFVFLH